MENRRKAQAIPEISNVQPSVSDLLEPGLAWNQVADFLTSRLEPHLVLRAQIGHQGNRYETWDHFPGPQDRKPHSITPSRLTGLVYHAALRSLDPQLQRNCFAVRTTSQGTGRQLGWQGVPSTVLVRVTIAVVKHRGQNQVGEERVYSASTSTSLVITEGSRGRNLELKLRPWEGTVDWLAHHGCFLIESRTTAQG